MPTLTPGDGQDLLERWKRAWERRDVDAIVALFSAEAVYREDPFSDELAGTNAIRERWNHIAANTASVEFDAERVWVADSTVLASWHAAYTRRQDGNRVRVRGFTTYELDDQLLVRRLRQWPVDRVVGRDSTFKLEAEA